MANPFRKRCILALMLALCILAGQASAQRLIVLTQARSVTGEIANLLAQSVDLYRLSALSTPVRLPGPHLTAPLTLQRDGHFARVSSSQRPLKRGTPDRGEAFSDTFMVQLQAVPFAAETLQPIFGTPHAEGWISANGDPNLRLMTWREAEAGDHVGGYTHLTPGNVSSGYLPHPPVAAARSGDRLYVLAAGETGPVVYRCEQEARRLMGFPPATLAGAGAQAVDIAPAHAGAGLLVASTARDVEAPENGEQTWIHLLHEDGSTIASEMRLQGVPVSRFRVFERDGAGTIWVATRGEGTGFTTLTGLRVSANRLEKTVERTLGVSPGGVHLAPAPEAGGIVAGWGTNLARWADDGEQAWRLTLDAPVSVVSWTTEGIFSGAGRVVALHHAADGSVLRSVALGSGWIADLVPIPAENVPLDDFDGDGLSVLQEQRRGTDATRADTDEDRIHDGVDPLPLTASPRLDLPVARYFHGPAAGQELQALVIDPGGEEDAPWSIQFNQEAMPWLRLFPSAGTGRRIVYMGIDPQHYRDDVHAVGALEVTMNSVRLGLPAVGSPATVRIHVLPGRSPFREILWVWGTPDAALRVGDGYHGLARLADALARAPQYFSHREIFGPAPADLSPFSLVVLDMQAVLQGAITRQAVLDYVAEGGAVLLLGEPLDPENTRPLREWLAPAGITLDTSRAIQGKLLAPEEWPFPEDPPNDLGYEAMPLMANQTDAALPLAAEPEVLALAATRYGHGRIGVAGHPRILSASPGLGVSIINWLAEAGSVFEDLDDDGLPDDREALREAGLYDPRLTDRVNPDTDGDGIPDGMEDRNRDGWVDEGETNPRNPDTDGDGIPDGADPAPLPDLGEPQILALSPARCPAEGGTLIRIQGRNFPPDAMFYFGNTATLRAGAVTPDLAVVRAPYQAADNPGAVDILLGPDPLQPKAILRSGFLYTERTTATLRIDQTETGPDGSGGTVGVNLLLSDPVPWDSAVFVVESGLDEPTVWGRITAAQGVTVRPLGNPDSGRLSVLVERNREAGWAGPVLFAASWQRPATAKKDATPTFSITSGRVTNAQGGILKTVGTTSRAE
jgi:hypothetical protein